MSIPCPACGKSLRIKEVHAGWRTASCEFPCLVQMHGPTEESIRKSLENKEWVAEQLELIEDWVKER